MTTTARKTTKKTAKTAPESEAWTREEHDRYRDLVQDVYMAVPSQGLYYNSRAEMEFTFKGSDGRIHKTYLDPMTSSAIVNALVPKSGVIYRGGHGGGKTTLVEKVTHMLTGIPEEDIVSAMIRGNDDQNVNTLLATLRLGKLMTSGEEDVLWRNFVTCPVKIIDEVNRFPPPAQNALFEILNKGRVEFSDQVYTIDDFIAFATENPNDPGTYPLSRPFVDRFAFCVPAPMLPAAQDQVLLAERPDDKLFSVSVNPVMTLDDLKKVRRAISTEVRMSADALIFTIYLTQAIASCMRGDNYDKSHNEIPVGERCKGCGHDTSVAACKMTCSGVSGRAFLDFQRWGKAYAWFLNAFDNPDEPEVQVEVLQTIAPYLLYHRVEPNEMMLGRDPYNGRKLAFIQDLVARTSNSYNTVKEALLEVPDVLSGKIAPDKAKVRDATKDLVAVTQFIPLIEEAGKKEFRAVYDYIAASEMTPQNLREVERSLAFGTELRAPAQKYLLSKALAKSRGEESI